MRYVLIDYMHLAHRCIAAEPLSTTVMIDGELELVDTTIPNYTIKNIVSYGGRGAFYTGVFFEGGANARKNYFSKDKTIDGAGYKGNRDTGNGPFFKGINLAMQLMLNGKVSLYRCKGYEADDLIYAMVQCIKEVDKETPIDVITNDADLLPLVDEQVSVYMRGTREYAEEGCPVRRLYYQVTPRTWEEYLSYTSAYKNYKIPYNSMLLYKMIKGDPSDNIAAACKGYGGVKYSERMREMETSVSLKEDRYKILYPLLKGKAESLLDIAGLKAEIDATYKAKGKEDVEKLKGYLEKEIRCEKLEKKEQTSLEKWKAKLSEEVQRKAVQMGQDYKELTVWFRERELAQMKEEGKELVTEFKNMFCKYFTQADYDAIMKEGFKIKGMFEEGVDFAKIFRYGVNFEEEMRPVLEKWFTKEEIEGMKYIYEGICLRGVKLNLPKQIDMGYLQQALQPVKIKIMK